MSEKRYPATIWTSVRNQTQNERGEWVPAIPEPYFMPFWVRCDCGKRFHSRPRYREHYAYAHILGGQA